MATLTLTFPPGTTPSAVTLTSFAGAPAVTTALPLAMVSADGQAWTAAFAGAAASYDYAATATVGGRAVTFAGRVAGDGAAGTGGPTAPTGAAAAIFRPGAVISCADAAGLVNAGSSFVLLARVLGTDGNPIGPSAVASIAATVTDVPDQTTANVAVPADLTTVVSATLRTDARWTEDGIGYNLGLTIPGTAVPTAGRTYEAVATVTTTGGDVFRLVWNLQAIG